MSRTKRKDPLDVEPKRPDYVGHNIVIPSAPTKRDLWRAHRDKKKGSKPGSGAKKYLHKGRRAKPKAALKGARDYEALSIEPEKKSDVWNYN